MKELQKIKSNCFFEDLKSTEKHFKCYLTKKILLNKNISFVNTEKFTYEVVNISGMFNRKKILGKVKITKHNHGLFSWLFFWYV